MKPLCEIVSLTDYLSNYGAALARKAIRSLKPLHTPAEILCRTSSEYPEHRTPLEAQQHVAAAFGKEIDKHGAGFLIGEPGCGKTITSIVTIHEHAKRSRRKGGKSGRYRAIVVCPDTLIEKWVREIETTIPDVECHHYKQVVRHLAVHGQLHSEPQAEA